MCTFHDPSPAGNDEYFVDALALTTFIEAVNEIRGILDESSAIVEAIKPHFATLLADPAWLPGYFQEPKEGSGMGGGIGTWLLYRAGDGSLAFSSLVVPPGVSTSVHDHLAWGVVGVYRGTQDEIVYQREDDGSNEAAATLRIMEERSLSPGGMYELLPATDIHQVRTTSDLTSVSLHLLSNDNGCIWRHRFQPDAGTVEPFRSGWLNVPCDKVASS